MKFMGHKAQYLPDILAAIESVSHSNSTVADLFCGTGAVANAVASDLGRRVVACDLQAFATVRARAIVERAREVCGQRMYRSWQKRAVSLLEDVKHSVNGCQDCTKWEPRGSVLNEGEVRRARALSASVGQCLRSETGMPWPIITAYGGHYFSPNQALVLDAYRNALPNRRGSRTIALAGLVEAASRCCAAPGHTAQPFSPRASGAKYLTESWNRCVESRIAAAVRVLGGIYAGIPGQVIEGGYERGLDKLVVGDVAFVDPPYSSVQYSRFYHVLETIVQQTEFAPEGVGRYPPRDQRPTSLFSSKRHAREEAAELVRGCARRGVNIVITYPESETSTGLSADDWERLVVEWYSYVDRKTLNSQLSTLGGNGENRASRTTSGEALIVAAL